MSRKLKNLLTELSMADPQTSAFLDISKKLVETYRDIQKEKAEKENKPKEPKEPKPKKEKKEIIVQENNEPYICKHCYDLLNNKLSEIIPKN